MIHSDGLADIGKVIDRARKVWRPPPRLALDQWADEYFRLSAESSAQAGRWTTLPYQRGIMQAMSDPRVTSVSVMKSARIGYTLMVSAAVGYYVHQDPCSILFVEPTVDDARAFSKETIAPMIRDVPVLQAIMREEIEDRGARDAGNTVQGKTYPGGRLSLIGANSGAGFRRRSCRVVILDEVDAMPPSAGSDGDPVKLATKRTEYFWDRKIFAGSTPLIAGISRIEALFQAGDQRRYYVPCPSCGTKDFLVFSKRTTGGGHYMVFDSAAPEGAHFVCSANGCVIEHKDKRRMVEEGEWRAATPFAGHASFHVWAAYSYSPNATWGQIAAEFLEAKRGGRETLRTFVNTTLGETFVETGEAPDWERLYARREQYQIGTVPDGVKFLTCGVDVQKDSWRYEVVGWSGREKESWSIDAGAIPGDTSDLAAWRAVDELLTRTYASPSGVAYSIRMLAVDAGFNTQQVYGWARGSDRSRVVAVKGVAGQHTLIAPPSSVDVLVNGKKHQRGAKVWPVGVSGAKSELYGWFRLRTPERGSPAPPGYCHFPEYGQEYFRQITAEHLVSTVNRKGYSTHEWQLIPGRENHFLDARIYARAAAAILGVDRMRVDPPRVPAVVPAPASLQPGPAARPPPPPVIVAPPAAAPAPPLKRSGLTGGTLFGNRQRGWLSKRR